MNILTAYYHVSYDILKEYLPYKPELKLTNAKSYYGRIYYNRGENGTIHLSKFNLYVRPEWIEEEDIEEIIDTICHEFAHIHFRRGHSEDHQKLTLIFKEMVIENLKLRKINRLLTA